MPRIQCKKHKKLSFVCLSFKTCELTEKYIRMPTIPGERTQVRPSAPKKFEQKPYVVQRLCNTFCAARRERIVQNSSLPIRRLGFDNLTANFHVGTQPRSSSARRTQMYFASRCIHTTYVVIRARVTCIHARTPCVGPPE